jgi:hypothetical protein
MALSSVGFDGTLSEQDWATMASLTGAQYAVRLAGDFQVSVHAGSTLTVDIAAGTAFGRGVTVVNTAQISIALDSVTSGARWDAIVIRRNWTTNTVTVEKITGTATRAVPAGRNNSPGTLDDQVIALVQSTFGQTLPTAVIDMRVFPSKVLTVSDLLAITNPAVGMEAVVLGGGTKQDTRWRYQLDPTGNAGWARDDSDQLSRTLTSNVSLFTQSAMITTAAGWTAGSLSNRALVDRNMVSIDIELRLTGARIVADANGNFPDQTIATINSAFAPDQQVPFTFLYFGGGSTAPTTFSPFGGIGYLNPSGNVGIYAGAPNIYINSRSSTDLTASVRANVTFMKAS